MAFINDTLLRLMTAVGGLRARLAEERGQDLIEYALLGGIVAVAFVVAAALLPLSGAMNDMVSGIAECVDFDATCP